MKSIPAQNRTRLFIKRMIACAALALAAPLASMAQQTVFYDNFATSTTNGVSTPGGTPTASSTSYDVVSAKNATATTIAPGKFSIITAATSSGGTEAQAVFTQNPVVLQATNDYVEMDYIFTDSTDVMNNVSTTVGAGNGVGLYCGLFNSGGVPPLSGAVLESSGLGSGTTADTGGTLDWVGYNAAMLNGESSAYDWSVGTRPVQTTLENSDQSVLYNFPNGGGTVNSASPGVFPFPNLVIGQQYTVQFRVTLTGANQLTVSNAMYQGTAVGGTVVWSTLGNFSGANFLTTNFNALALGYRAGDGQSVGWTNSISSITVIAGLAAQAGPYYSMTTSGNGCGGTTLGLNGSVTTNVYLLYDNGVNTGVSQAGTGSSLSFGFISTPGVYTVIASNTVTASEGPMYGSASISSGPPVVSGEPASVTAVTNIPVNFTIAATGTSLSYQWYKNGIILTNGGDVSGAKTASVAINPTQAGDVAGYSVVISDPCGDLVTSTPIANLTLIPPHNLVWQGGSDGNWDFTEPNFTSQAGPLVDFTNGDDVIFNSSGNPSVNVTNAVTSTLVTVNASQPYTFNGPGKITGFSQVVVGGTGGLTIGNLNDYTGGTIVSNGATLTLGTGSGNSGTVAGIVTVASGGILNYSYGSSSANNTDPIYNGFAGSGTVNFNDAAGATIATPLSVVSSNFNGTINIQGFTALHASNGNSGYPLGNGSTINAPDGTQIWLDNSSLAYNMALNIGGTGWQGVTPQTGALRIYDCTVNGPITMMDNARIGGSINGATIQSVISGSYQLEIWGNTNSFVLVMGPTNGAPQGYASTLITSGAISCFNSNAVSAGLLTEDAGGDFQLNGNNVTVADLTSINSGNVGWLAGPTVRNNNTTNGAVLTVGGDNNSEEYDGTFLNGSTQPLGLTKIGNGTLTLTGVSSNSGTVTVTGGSIALTSGGPVSSTGNFTAASFAIGSGASFNVSGRSDDTLTLNSNQKLAGQGTVTGNVIANSGSTLVPGLPTGTLTVSGTVTMNSGSTYLANLNRANSPNSGKLSASSVTYNGTLAVTNVGAELQTGDTFQLFSTSGVSGFTSFALQTVDVPNNAVYTWNNTVTSNGKITVSGVSVLVNTNATPILYTNLGTSLVLAWPADHIGWKLQSQTNSLAVGVTGNWTTISNSITTNMVIIPLTRTNATAFFRLRYN